MNSVAAPSISTTSRAELARFGVWASTVALVAIGLLLVTRRLAGALSNDLEAARLVLTLFVAVAIICGGRALWRRACGARSVRAERALAWSGSAALSLMCFSCAPPSLHSAAWLLWLPLIALDHFSRRAFLSGNAASRTARPRAPSNAEPTVARIVPAESTLKETDSDGEILQQLIRVRDAAGVESIRGTLRADFAAGQRHATLHVGFCPPLSCLPEIEVELADGPDAAVKVVQAFAHGARVDVRLSEPAEEPCSAIVEIVAGPSIDI